jgi:hypothetical protein
MRTTRESVTFDHPFSLYAVDGVQPAGTYTVDVDEDLIEGLSFLAYRRIATTIYLPLRHGGPASVQAVRVDPRELDEARRKPELPLL